MQIRCKKKKIFSQENNNNGSIPFKNTNFSLGHNSSQNFFLFRKISFNFSLCHNSSLNFVVSYKNTNFRLDLNSGPNIFLSYKKAQTFNWLPNLAPIKFLSNDNVKDLTCTQRKLDRARFRHQPKDGTFL